MKKYLLLSLILFIGLTITSMRVEAQSILDGKMEESVGTWEDMPGGTESFSGGDDVNRSWDLPDDFDFLYDGVDVSKVHLNTNGWLKFETSTSDRGTNIGDENSALSIGWMWEDLYTDGKITVDILGDAPKRVIVFQWNDIRFYGTTPTNKKKVQIRLYEGSHNIDLIYGPSSDLKFLLHQINAGLDFQVSGTRMLR